MSVFFFKMAGLRPNLKKKLRDNLYKSNLCIHKDINQFILEAIKNSCHINCIFIIFSKHAIELI